MSHDFTRVDSANPPDYFNIGFDVVDVAAAGDDRNRLALIWVGDAGQRRTLTYWELSTASNRVTNLLRELGVRGGDRVLLAMPRTPEWWTVALGVIKRGAVLVPLDASFTGAALLDACAAVAPTMIVADPARAAQLERALAQPDAAWAAGVAHRAVVHAAPHETLAPVSAEAPAGWIDLPAMAADRSGILEHFGFDQMTTPADTMLIAPVAAPEGGHAWAVHSHAHTLAQGRDARAWFGVGRRDLHLTLTTDSWNPMLWCSLFGPWVTGGTIVVHEPAGVVDTAFALRMIERLGVTSICAQPNLYRALVEAGMPSYDVSCIANAVCAGAVDAATAEQWSDGTQGIPLRPGFGRADTTLLVGWPAGSQPTPGTLGPAAEGIHADVVTEHLQIAVAEQEGWLAARAFPDRPLGLAGEYLDARHQDAVYRDDWFVTAERVVASQAGVIAARPGAVSPAPAETAYTIALPNA